MEFSHMDKVMVYDSDYQGIAHYASYYRFITNAIEAFKEKRMDKLEKKFSNIWFVVAESKAVYLKPLRVGDRITVKLSPEIATPKALKFNFRIFKGSILATEGYLLDVCIDRKKWKPVDIPIAIIKAVRAG
ncbi:MAG: thioesterase family protein [Candidatus Micrarchaeaceae archaeon]